MQREDRDEAAPEGAERRRNGVRGDQTEEEVGAPVHRARRPPARARALRGRRPVLRWTTRAEPARQGPKPSGTTTHHRRQAGRQHVRLEHPIFRHRYCLLAEQPFEIGNPTDGVTRAGCPGRHAAEIEPCRTGPLGPDDQIPEQWVRDPHALQIARP